jgi:reverse gyrase
MPIEYEIHLVWKCATCGSTYAEYVNGCPHCWEAGIRSKVDKVEGVRKGEDTK